MYHKELGHKVLQAIHARAGKLQTPVTDDVGDFADNVLFVTRKTLLTRMRDGDWTWQEMKILYKTFRDVPFVVKAIEEDLKAEE